MTPQEYANEIARLERQFGAFGEERTRLLWLQVKHLSLKWFIGVITEFICNSHRMPLIADFLDQIAIEREREHQREKERHANDAKKFLKPGWPPLGEGSDGYGARTNEETQEMARVICELLNPLLSEDERTARKSYVNSIAENSVDRDAKSRVSRYSLD